jgi:serine/threonine protein kinase
MVNNMENFENGKKKRQLTLCFILVAPEVLDPSEVRGYGTECDLWSLGVMMYICLCGYPPFSEENGPPSMKSQIKMGKYSFASPYWDNVSAEGKKKKTSMKNSLY